MESSEFQFVHDGENDEVISNELSKRVVVVFVIGHSPGSDPVLEITRLAVDAVSVWPIKLIHLGGNQGVGVELGSFESGRTIQLQWGFRTGPLPVKRELFIGVYRNTMRDATIYRKLEIDSFQTFDGVEAVSTTPKN